MFKRFKPYKTIQMIICIAIAVAGVYFITSDTELYHLVATNSSVKTLCIMLWAILALSFLFIFIDFNFISNSGKHLNELDYAVHSDPTSGLANRYSCDMIIEKYLDQPLPADIGCIMFDLVNIKSVNAQFGHVAGNQVIRDFSNILLAASADLCFVGRNGGNKFMALFEGYTPDDIDTFLSLTKEKVAEHNAAPGAHPIKYKFGIALADKSNAATITDLVAESNRHIYAEEDGK